MSVQRTFPYFSLLVSILLGAALPGPNTAHAQSSFSAPAYTHQIYEVVVTTVDESVAFRVLATSPDAVDPTVPGYALITAGNDNILSNDPEIVTEGAPLIAANDPEIVTDCTTQNDPEIVTDCAENDPEIVTDSFDPGREYWFHTSTGAGGSPTITWTLLFDRFGNDPEIVTELQDMVDYDVFLGVTGGDGSWGTSPSLPAGAETYTLTGISHGGDVTPALYEVTVAMTYSSAGTPQIPSVYMSNDVEVLGVGATSSGALFQGLTAPAAVLLGRESVVNPVFVLVSPSVLEGASLDFESTSAAGAGLPTPTWYEASY